MTQENGNTACFYVENDIPGSWQRMESFASTGKQTWIKCISCPQLKLVDLLCCLGHCCVGRSEGCSLDNCSVIFIGKNEGRKGLHLAIQVFPEPTKLLLMQATSQKLIWLEPRTGRFFRRTQPPKFGKDIDRIEGVQKCRGVEVKLGCYVLGDDSWDQHKTKELRKKRKWELDKNPDAVYFQVTGKG
jgi:hypothetical protein